MFEDVPTLEDLPPVRGANVLVRADLNVALRRSLAGPEVIADDFRIRAVLPTLEWLVDRGAVVTVASHLGRPGGRPDPSLRMDPVRVRLEELLPGVSVLENLRFDPGEEANDEDFGWRLARGQDLYVNDAFGVCHRRHASVLRPPAVLPSAAGRLLRRELDVLGRVIEGPARPFTLVVGGAKVADKLGTIRALARRADHVLIGGAMAFTFLVAMGCEVGASLVDRHEVEACRVLLGAGTGIDLPTDLVAAPVADELGAHEPPGAAARRFFCEVPRGWRAFDIGPETAERFARRIEDSATVLWNGPMGVFEDARFAAGTNRIVEAMAACRGFTVAGGGDTVSAIEDQGAAGRIDHLSSGGGAMLHLIEDGDLPGLAALRESAQRWIPRTASPPAPR